MNDQTHNSSKGIPRGNKSSSVNQRGSMAVGRGGDAKASPVGRLAERTSSSRNRERLQPAGIHQQPLNLTQ